MPTSNNDTADLDELRLPDLQDLYHRVVGEPTRCPNRGFLMRRILEVRGSAPRATTATRTKAKSARRTQAPRKAVDEAAAMMVLPVRMDATLVARLDEAWRRRGMKSRMDLFRRALRAFLLSIGEREVAALVMPKP